MPIALIVSNGLALDQQQIPRHRMAPLEDHRMDGERGLFLPIRYSMVCVRTPTAGCGSCFVLVAEPGRIVLLAPLRAVLPARLGFCLCVSVHMDSVCSESRDPQEVSDNLRVSGLC